MSPRPDGGAPAPGPGRALLMPAVLLAGVLTVSGLSRLERPAPFVMPPAPSPGAARPPETRRYVHRDPVTGRPLCVACHEGLDQRLRLEPVELCRRCHPGHAPAGAAPPGRPEACLRCHDPHVPRARAGT